MSRNTVNTLLFGGFAAICLGGILFMGVNMGLELPGSSQFRLDASFDSVNGLVQYADVRIAGVKVGHVSSITPASDNGSVVHMALDRDYQLRSDLRALVRPKSLLGEKYVELVRTSGSTASVITSGASLGRDHTGQAVEIDDALNLMDAQTRAAMTTSFRQLGVAVAGRAVDVNSSLSPVDQVAQNLRPLAQLSARRQQNINHILGDVNTIMAALADEHDQLGHIVDSGDRTFSAFAGRDAALAGTVQQASTFFNSLDLVFADLTPSDRKSLEASPGSIAAGSAALALTSREVDRLIPELLLGQVNYPNNQLNVTHDQALWTAREWESAFYQHDVNGNTYRVTNISGCQSTGAGNLCPPGTNAAPAPAAASTPVDPAAFMVWLEVQQ
ncbi:MAG: MlaD family protein [Candidatus Dormibacteria bacterium]